VEVGLWNSFLSIPQERIRSNPLLGNIGAWHRFGADKSAQNSPAG